MPIENRITIIEGPPPNFIPIYPESHTGKWQMSAAEQMLPAFGVDLLTGRVVNDDQTENGFAMVETGLRVANGPAMIERCLRTWNAQGEMRLYYRDMIGLEQSAPIFAARNVETPDGYVLILWLRLTYDQYISMNPPLDFDPV